MAEIVDLQECCLDDFKRQIEMALAALRYRNLDAADVAVRRARAADERLRHLEVMELMLRKRAAAGGG
jgi:hypothetical protein